MRCKLELTRRTREWAPRHLSTPTSLFRADRVVSAQDSVHGGICRAGVGFTSLTYGPRKFPTPARATARSGVNTRVAMIVEIE